MPQILQGDKMSNLATKPKIALAALIGLVAGVVSAFVKWVQKCRFHQEALWICLTQLADQKVPSERLMRSTAREIF